MKTIVVLSTTAGLLFAAALAALVVVYSGIYHVGATEQHTQTVYSLLETTMRHSVRVRARDTAVPELDDAQRIHRGAAIYRANCVVCHGGPGVAQGAIGKGMQPVPGPLVDALQRWQPREIYWIVRHGIKMSGMPAWEFRMDDAQLWDVVAFVRMLRTLTAQDYRRMTGTSVASDDRADGGGARTEAATANPGDPERGVRALYQYACNACHTIPGVTGSAPNVGPPLEGLARRTLIAGKLDNTPANLVEWLRHPQRIKPATTMPDLGVSEAHATDMAAYLATLE